MLNLSGQSVAGLLLILTADGRHAGTASIAARFAGNNPFAQLFLSSCADNWRDILLYPFTEIAREYSRAITSAKQVERFGAGITIEDRTVGTLEMAIDSVLGDWDTFSARACEASRVLAREHDPIHIVKLLGINSEHSSKKNSNNKARRDW